MNRSEVFAKVWESFETGELVVVCSWCGRVCLNGEWVGPTPGVLSTLDQALALSHSICPACAGARLSNAASSRGSKVDAI